MKLCGANLHEMTEENRLYTSSGSICRACHNIRTAKSVKKTREKAKREGGRILNGYIIWPEGHPKHRRPVDDRELDEKALEWLIAEGFR